LGWLVDAAKAICAVLVVLAWGTALIFTLLYQSQFFLPVLTGSGFPMWALERLLRDQQVMERLREIESLLE